jgi:hypothetical protein
MSASRYVFCSSIHAAIAHADFDSCWCMQQSADCRQRRSGLARSRAQPRVVHGQRRTGSRSCSNRVSRSVLCPMRKAYVISCFSSVASANCGRPYADVFMAAVRRGLPGNCRRRLRGWQAGARAQSRAPSPSTVARHHGPCRGRAGGAGYLRTSAAHRHVGLAREAVGSQCWRRRSRFQAHRASFPCADVAWKAFADDYYAHSRRSSSSTSSLGRPLPTQQCAPQGTAPRRRAACLRSAQPRRRRRAARLARFHPSVLKMSRVGSRSGRQRVSLRHSKK